MSQCWCWRGWTWSRCVGWRPPAVSRPTASSEGPAAPSGRGCPRYSAALTARLRDPCRQRPRPHSLLPHCPRPPTRGHGEIRECHSMYASQGPHSNCIFKLPVMSLFFSLSHLKCSLCKFTLTEFGHFRGKNHNIFYGYNQGIYNVSLCFGKIPNSLCFPLNGTF